MGALRSVYNFLFALPDLPEPYTRNPVIRANSMTEILGMIGLADQIERVTPGNRFNLPMRTGPNGLRPYIQIDVGSRDRLLRVNIHHLDDNSSIHIDIRQNPETGIFFFDKLDNMPPHPDTNRSICCDSRKITRAQLQDILNIVRLAVTHIKLGGLDDLQRTHSDLTRLMPVTAKPDNNPAHHPS